MAKLTPAEGVIPFFPNARQWQDGATAEYLIALPDKSSVSFFDKPRPLPGQVFWHDFKMQFPRDTVLVKTISLDVLVEGRQVEKRIETQMLHYDGEDWRGYSYAWRNDQTDADLVPADGAEATYTVAAGRKEREGRLDADRQARTGVDVPQPHAVHAVSQFVVRIRAGVHLAAVEPPAAVRRRRRAEPTRPIDGDGLREAHRRGQQGAPAVQPGSR